MTKRFRTILVPFLLAGCGADGSMNVSAAEAENIANETMSNAFPTLPMNIMTVNSTMVDGNWHVSYTPPEGYAGAGPLTVIVNEASGNVIRQD